MRIAMLFFLAFINSWGNNLIEIVLPNNEWKLIGVPGAFMEGSGSTSISTGGDWYFGVRKGDQNLTGQDDINYTKVVKDGSTGQYNSLNHLVGFRTRSSKYSSVTLSAKLGDFSVDKYLPVRKMYIDSNGDGVADTNISYQSDLEGELFQFQTVSITHEEKNYYGYFNSSYGESNPATLSKLSGTSSNYTYSIREIIDMNLTNNPGKDGQNGDILDYQRNNNRDDLTTGDDWIRVFRLDANNSVWESFYSDIADSSNDFTKLVSGSGYWVKLHDKTESTKKHGFILGDGNLSLTTYSSTYYPLSEGNSTSRFAGHSLLSNGWNMLSFPNGYIRYSGTGLRLKKSGTVNDENEITVADEVGKEILVIKILDIDHDGSCSTQEIVQSINSKIKGAIEDGNLSKNFNLKAYRDDNNYIILLSDRKFRVYDKKSGGGTDDVFQNVTTIGNQYPLDLATNSYKDVTDLGTTGVASKYGEYVLIVTVNNDNAGNSAGSLNSANQQIGKAQINSNTAINLADSNAIDDLDDNFQSDSDIDIALDIDIDDNGYDDSFILVNTSSPFYIRDHTFTKVYRLDDNHSLQNGDPNIYIDKTGDGTAFTTVTLDEGNDTSDIVIDLDDALSTDIKSKDSGDYIFMTTIDSSYRKFDLKEYGNDDIFTRIVSSNALALGAITKVYSIEQLAKSDVNKSIYIFDFNASDVDANDELNVTVDGVTSFYDIQANDDAGKICINLASQINSSASNVYAECNTTTESDTNAKITLTGYFNSATLRVYNSDGELDLNISGAGCTNQCGNIPDSNSSRFWDRNSSGGVALKDVEALTDDLRYFPIYSPNFPTSDSILPYIRENGYKVKSMLTAIDNGSGSISWKYIDLTVDTDKWFSPLYDYSLFSTEIERGYFALLSKETPANLILTPNLNLNYYQHYNNDNNRTGLSTEGHVDNLFKGTLSATLSGDEGDNSQVVATIQNKDYTMLKSGNRYTLELTRDNFPYIAMDDSNITLTAYDETGNTQTAQLEFNLSSPAKPVFRFFNGKIAFVGTTSSDLSAFNIYNGRIDDRYANHPSNSNRVRNLNSSNDYKTANNYDAYYGNTDRELLGSLPIDGVEYNKSIVNINYDGSSIGNVTRTGYSTYYFMVYNICADAPDFDTNNSGWEIVAVDGDGDVGNSRVSDITFLNEWYGIYKNASVLRVHNNDTTDNQPALYDADCLYTSTKSIDNGVVLVDINSSDDLNITIAYDTISTTSVQSVIATERQLCWTYAGHDNTFAKIQFNANKYTTNLNSSLTSPKTLLIDLNNTFMFKTTFDKLYEHSASSCFDVNDSTDHNSTQLDISAGQYILKGE